MGCSSNHHHSSVSRADLESILKSEWETCTASYSSDETLTVNVNRA